MQRALSRVIGLDIGPCALAWHLSGMVRKGVTDTVRVWRDSAPALLPLPHPSPRNSIWLKANCWFARDLPRALQARVRELLGPAD